MIEIENIKPNTYNIFQKLSALPEIPFNFSFYNQAILNEKFYSLIDFNEAISARNTYIGTCQLTNAKLSDDELTSTPHASVTTPTPTPHQSDDDSVDSSGGSTFPANEVKTNSSYSCITCLLDQKI